MQMCMHANIHNKTCVFENMNVILSHYTIFTITSDIKECESNPCVNGGNCTEFIEGYNCTCVPGYTGIHCETGV